MKAHTETIETTDPAQLAAVNKYYEKSRRGYDLLLWGAKHFGYHPLGESISEREAQARMHDVLASKLQIDSGMRLLDAGCGQGVVATDLAMRYGCSVHGITVVPFEVDEARKWAAEHKVTNRVKLELMDYSQMSFGASVFDGVFTMETLSHSPDPAQTLGEFWRVLRPGGRIALFEYSLTNDSQFTQRERRILDLVIRGSAMAGLKVFRHNCFHKVIRSAGFVDIRTEDISEHVLPSIARLRRYARIPYIPVRMLRLQRFYPNVTAATEFHEMVVRGLIRYNIYTASRGDA